MTTWLSITAALGARSRPSASRTASLKTIVGPVQPAVYPPLAEVVVDRLPGRVFFGQHPPRTPAPEQVEDGVRDVPVRPLRRTATLLGRREQRFEDGPLLVGEVGRVVRWGHDGLRASGGTDIRILLRRPSEAPKSLFAKLALRLGHRHRPLSARGFIDTALRAPPAGPMGDATNAGGSVNPQLRVGLPLQRP